MKEIIAKIKELFLKWKETFCAVCSHPVQYCREYFQGFRAMPLKDKAIKILQAAAFVFVTLYLFWLVISIFVAYIAITAILASGGIEYRRVQRAQWMANEYGGSEADYL